MGNEVGISDPVFMRKYGAELEKESGKWIDSSVWHGKAHTWEKIKWLIGEVRARFRMHANIALIRRWTVEPHLGWPSVPHQGHPVRGGRAQGAHVPTAPPQNLSGALPH